MQFYFFGCWSVCNIYMPKKGKLHQISISKNNFQDNQIVGFLYEMKI